ncbi:MAG: lipoyl(octanoyl) transferase LipB [Candidatus Omnitrophota bacterium]
MIIDLGMTGYEECYKVQREFCNRRKLGEIADSLIIAEHMPVFTLGRLAKEENLLVDRETLKSQGIKVLDVDRGGDVTFHGPGQIVLYPILNLKERKTDLHRYMRDIEEGVLTFLKYYAVSGHRINGRTGVWVGDRKISFIGIAARDWITYHGVSINIDVDLRFFSMIRPCGLSGIKVANLNTVSAKPVLLADAKHRIASCFADIFGLKSEDYRGKLPTLA